MIFLYNMFRIIKCVALMHSRIENVITLNANKKICIHFKDNVFFGIVTVYLYQIGHSDQDMTSTMHAMIN